MDWKKLIPSNWQQLLAWLVLTIASMIAGALTNSLINPPPPPMPIWQASFGWVNDPGEVEAVASTLRFKVFSDTPAGQSQDDLPKSVYMWDAFKKVTGDLPPRKNQLQVGSCVSFGTNNAIVRTMAVDLALAKKTGTYKDIAEEVTYGGSRVQIGGGRIRSDGSVGAWAAQFVQKFGVVPRENVAGVDLSKYSESRCRQYGDPPGPPVGVLTAAKDSPVKEITLVKTWAEAKKSLANGYAIAICSNQGFSMTRDPRGVAQASGSWAHCMCLDGYHVEGSEEYGHIENSWGPDAHRGPVGWGNPSTAGFWTSSKTIERMLSQGDSWALSGVVGFPSRNIDWFVLSDVPRQNPIAQRSKYDGPLFPGLLPSGDCHDREPVFAYGGS